MLHLGAFREKWNHGLGKNQFNCISRTLVSILRYVKEKVWSHIDEVKKHIFTG